ncbi:MAG: 16S rRNA processing protein RimM [Desulfovibrio sp.]|nr:16S rRNA processing protein RimM [Desulfovibrio sp.]
MAEAFVHMGTLGRPHGISGEIALNWFAVSPFSCSGEYFLQAGDRPPAPVRVLSAHLHKDRPVIRIEGVEDRTSAAALTGRKVLVRRSSLPEPADGEAYVSDLLGCGVFLEDGTPVGRFDHVEHSVGRPVWAIVAGGGREMLFPAEPDFILSLDAAAGRIVIAPPPGLLELYLEESAG